MRDVRIFVDHPRKRYRFDSPVATVGNFDGVHLGHQKILTSVAMRVRMHRGTAVVVTFDPHPAKVFRGSSEFKALMTEDQKIKMFKTLGIDAFIKIPFNEAFSRKSPETFVKGFLVRRLGVHELYVGMGFRFGQGRRGDVGLLQSMGAELGFSAFGIEQVYLGGALVSSTRIRKALERGDVHEAARCLGRLYSIEGMVVFGKRRGKTLGFPTANLAPFNEILPAPGVYATRCLTKGRRFNGATFIGPRPTFGEEQISVETFILDQTIKLYGEGMALEFIERIRNVQKFNSPTALSAQIRRDVSRARRILTKADENP